MTDKDQLANNSHIDPEIQAEAEKIAEQISRFINSMCSGREKAKALGQAMLKDHRTLLQTKFLIAHEFINGLAVNYTDRYFDERNKRACELSNKMISALETDDVEYLPFI
jgi:hypothetical protein